MSPKILLVTLNATYFHSAFGLRYLHANLKELKDQTEILEATTAFSPADIAETILARNPAIVGFGVYIWNTRQTLDVISFLKRVRPELLIIIGGPEVSHETEGQPLVQLSDYTVKGEGDFLFYELCRKLLDGNRPPQRVISGTLPEIDRLEMPYSLYSDEDIRHRVIYVEASRGCPYRCEFCLSSLDKSVRSFHLDRFLAEMDRLLERGVTQFKFVDRTFNLSIAVGTRILQFFLDRMRPGLFLHFEMVPDRLPEELKHLIQKFPTGSLQFEIGIQTWNPEVAKLVSRRQDYAKVRDNFKFLTEQTGVHLHADLIVGLPSETLESFANGFDEVALLGAHEIQVGILKRLKGTPIVRHDGPWEMVYQEHPPFQVIRTKTMSFETIQSLARFAKFWDLYANSGNFPNTMGLLRKLSAHRQKPSLFAEMFQFSEFLATRHAQRHSIALRNLVESAWRYLCLRAENQSAVTREQARMALLHDYTGYVKRDVPEFLRDGGAGPVSAAQRKADGSELPPRQSRHRSTPASASLGG